MNAPLPQWTPIESRDPDEFNHPYAALVVFALISFVLLGLFLWLIASGSDVVSSLPSTTSSVVS